MWETVATNNQYVGSELRATRGQRVKGEEKRRKVKARSKKGWEILAEGPGNCSVLQELRFARLLLLVLLLHRRSIRIGNHPKAFRAPEEANPNPLQEVKRKRAIEQDEHVSAP